MYLFVIVFVILLEGRHVSGADGTSLHPRRRCFRDVQPNCNEEFINKYPKLSKSASGLVNATTWFLLYTRNNTDQPELLHKCGGKLPRNSNFNPKNRLIIITVPYNTAYCDVAVYREWTAQILEREDVNILIIDYGWGNHLELGEAKLNTKIVAKQSIIVLKNMQDQRPFKSKQIHLIGHSLGAQLCGHMGHLWFKKTGTLFQRITGLDVGSIGFPQTLSKDKRLDRTDAEFVDVWHTGGGDCLPYAGINYDAGDVDFYVNGGHSQPSCLKYTFISLFKEDYFYALSNILLPSLCPHSQSTQYFKVSINPGDCQFVGVKCASYEDYESGKCSSCGTDGSKCLIMSYDTDKYYKKTKKHQKYFVSTSLDCPYCNNSNIALEGYAETYN